MRYQSPEEWLEVCVLIEAVPCRRRSSPGALRRRVRICYASSLVRSIAGNPISRSRLLPTIDRDSMIEGMSGTRPPTLTPFTRPLGEPGQPVRPSGTYGDDWPRPPPDNASSGRVRSPSAASATTSHNVYYVIQPGTKKLDTRLEPWAGDAASEFILVMYDDGA